MHAHVVAAHKTTTPLTKMSPETVEGDPKRRDVENMTDQYALPIERNDGRAPSQDRSKGIVTHTNTKVLNWVRDHVVHGANVRHDQLKSLHELLRGDGPVQCRHKSRRENDIVW